MKTIAKAWKKWILIMMCVFTVMGNSVSAQANSRSTKSTVKDSNTCQHGSCKKKKKSGSNFCVSHTCVYPGCTREVNARNEKCSAHKHAAYPKSSSSGSSFYSSKRKSSSGSSKTGSVDKSRYSDYEDMYEDNEDDFEDLDDAEDYWDNN